MPAAADTPIPSRFAPALAALRALARDDRYRGVLLFGSVALGVATPESDLDVLVLTDGADACANLSHPAIGGVKLDLSFNSLARLRDLLDAQLDDGGRRPMLAGGRILFDKDGDLTALRARADAARPRPVPPERHRHIQFLFFHLHDKIARFLTSDPPTALLSLHLGLNEALDWHYRLRGEWRVSAKWLLADLRRWDAPLADLVARLVATGDLAAKYALWNAIVEHILAPLGGRGTIVENICPCPACTADLAALLASDARRAPSEARAQRRGRAIRS